MTNIKEHEGLVHAQVKKYALAGTQRYNDMFEAGKQGLQTASEKFDPAKNTKFSTYATYWIKAKVLEILRKEMKQPAKIHLEDVPEQSSPTVQSVENEVDSRVDVEAFLKELPEREKDILQMYYGLKPYSQPYPMTEIAQELKVSVPRIKQLIEQAKGRIKKLHGTEETKEERKEVISMKQDELIPLEKLESGEYKVEHKTPGTFQRIRENVLKLVPAGKAMRVIDIIRQVPELANLKGPRRYNYLENAMKKSPGVKFITIDGMKFLGISKATETKNK